MSVNSTNHNYRSLIKQPKATGGSMSQINNDLISIFETSGTFVVGSTITANVMIVGGGAGGEKVTYSPGTSGYAGRGGCGGDAISQTSFTINPGTYTITIGSGGTGATVNGFGATGGTTLAFGLTATGGSGSTPYTNATFGLTDGFTFISAGGSGDAGTNPPVKGTFPRGGAGVTSTITGANRSYGSGGGGGGMATGSDVVIITNNSGGRYSGNLINPAEFGDGGSNNGTSVSDGEPGIWGGGGGGNAARTTGSTSQSSSGGNGGSGIVVIRWTN